MGWLSALLKTGATLGAGALGGPLAGAAVGGAIAAGDEKKRANEVRRQNLAKSEANRYSPLTGRWQGMDAINENMMKAATGGAAGGFMQGQAMQKYMGQNPNMFNFSANSAGPITGNAMSGMAQGGGVPTSIGSGLMSPHQLQSLDSATPSWQQMQGNLYA